MYIKEVIPKIIKDSRGENTIEVSVVTHEGTFSASAPYGKSRGKYETPAFHKNGIKWSIKLLNNFCYKFTKKNLVLKDLIGLAEFEKEIKFFEKDFGKMGANATYALEVAFLKASAKEQRKELWQIINGGEFNIPSPIGNCIGGGMHSKGVDGKRPDFQEFLLIPQERRFVKNVEKNLQAYELAGKLLKKKMGKLALKRNDEGAWETNLNNEEVLQLLEEIAMRFDLRLGVDFAASTFYSQKNYNYKNKILKRTKEEQIEYIIMLANRYNLLYLEDPMQEEDFLGLGKIELNLKNRMVTGDDLTVTDSERLRTAVDHNSINAIIIKPNQNGYLADVAKVVEFARKNKVKIIFSHRSGETMDNALADLAVGFKADYIKCGIFGKERLIKLKRLIEIERELEKNKVEERGYRN